MPVPPPPTDRRPTPPRPGRDLPLGLRSRLRLRHGVRLGREVSRYGSEQGLWWLVPLVTVMVILALAVTTTTSALPVAVYALF